MNSLHMKSQRRLHQRINATKFQNRIHACKNAQWYGDSKLTINEVRELKRMYYDPAIRKQLKQHVGTRAGNGRVLTYDRIFARTFAEEFGLTVEGLYYHVARKSKAVRLLWKALG